MKWKNLLYLFTMKPEIPGVHNNLYNKPNELDTPSRSIFDGRDHRPINETDTLFSMKMFYYRMQLLKVLEDKDISMYDKLESLDGNKWLIENLLAGDSVVNW